MTQDYIHDNFLLTSELAQHLYHEYAAELPIIDYHNHLDAKDIWLDTNHDNLAQAWLHSDHYVWRAMRSNGIDEQLITGDASDEDKFAAWCDSMPYLLGNPLYQWSHLELKRFFGSDLLLNPANRDAIWQQAEERLASGEISTRKVLQDLKVDALCTTDSPLASLEYHQLLADSDFDVSVLPTFRADELFTFAQADAWHRVANQLATLCQRDIRSFDDYLACIEQRIQFFHQAGCRLSDLGLTLVEFETSTPDECEQIFQRLLARQELSSSDVVKLKTLLFTRIGQMYHQLDWTMQLHIGVLVNVNARRKSQLGPGTGFSVINDRQIAENLTLLLSSLDESRNLPKTVLYNLNPQHNAILSCIAGAFQDSDSAAGKIQFGAAWWFNDHKDGMEQQLTTLKNLGALGRFVGMLTDSRNIYSMSRHEYFRRVFCNLLAQWVEQGEIPNDQDLLAQTIRNVCYDNARQYFNFSSSAI